MFDPASIERFIDGYWDDSIVPALSDYIRIPCLSPAFDVDWPEAGHVDEALKLALDWLDAHALPGMTVEVGRLPGRTPVILVDVPGDALGTVLLYGHLDKQPEMEGWDEASGPWEPRLTDGRLYGRGGADDGYALFASICALAALQEQEVPHARAVLLIEFSEESGSPDLPAYVDHFAERIGQVELVICLDSGAGNYDQLWSTTSLRGMVGGTLRADVLTEGIHSGDGSGVVAESFRVLRGLLDRIEDSTSGVLTLPTLHVEIPPSRIAQAERVAGVVGDEMASRYPWVPGIEPMPTSPVELILNRTWRPTLTITGQDGLPSCADAGNVLRPFTRLKLSFRLPPTLDPETARAALTEALTSAPAASGAPITLELNESAQGWNAPELAPWLEAALDDASNTFYGKPALHMGEGGSIPFMSMLSARFPLAQFLITGVLGPNSNAHGPNEFLDVPYSKKLTCCTAAVLARHGSR